MTYLSNWEKHLLSTLLNRYESGDFNCGASLGEMQSVSCAKSDDYTISPKCNTCKYRKRFLKLIEKVS